MTLAPNICNETKHKNTLTISFMFLYVFGPEEQMHGLRIHPGQIRCSGALKPPPVEPTVCGDMGWPVEVVDVDTEDLGWLRRLQPC